MKSTNRRAIIIILGTLLGISILGGVSSVLGVYYLLYLPFSLHYSEIDAQKAIAHVEDRYSFCFPAEIYNVKAAKAYGDLDGSSSFVLKFNIPSENMGAIMFGPYSRKEILDYTEGLDWRLKHENYPDWYKVPIEQGKIITVQAPANVPDVYFTIEVYVDMSNEKDYVVYMEGAYKSGNE
ncbi:MAG TPA: hypothetical protein PKB02_18490 [Anaerohalosphaeraceae bacterium]|nr:hypothetical protein [Anaerohalosphaeraceae bacterium]